MLKVTFWGLGMTEEKVSLEETRITDWNNRKCRCTAQTAWFQYLYLDQSTEFTTGNLLFRTIIFFVASYGCETWSLKLCEERRLRVLRRIFAPMRDEVTGEWRKLHNEETNYLYSSFNIFQIMKSRMRWSGHVALIGERRGVCMNLVVKPERKRPLGEPGIDGRKMLRWIFRKWDVRSWTGSIRLRIGTGGGHLWMR